MDINYYIFLFTLIARKIVNGNHILSTFPVNLLRSLIKEAFTMLKRMLEIQENLNTESNFISFSCWENWLHS